MSEITSGILRFLRKNSERSTSPTQRILPSSVRYALKYRGGELFGKEIESLADNGFVAEALYLASKALAVAPHDHRDFVKSVVEANTDPQNLKKIVAEYAHKIPEGNVVQGKKLAQFSRQGFDTWHERFAETARECVEGEDIPVLIAHSMMAGLPEFSREFAGADKKFIVIIPEWIENDFSSVGYEVNPKYGQVEDFVLDSTKPVNVKFIDDAYNTGEHARSIWNNWYGNSTPFDSSQFIIVQGSNPPQGAV